MLEYVFFDAVPCNRFQEFLNLKGVEHQPPSGEEVLMIAIPEDLDEDLISEIESYYDDMMELGSEILSNQTGDGQVNTAGLTVTLNDGRISYAVLDPALVNKMLDVLSLEELNTVVNAIADAVENPNDTPICKRVY